MPPLWSPHGSENRDGVYGVLMAKEDLTKMSQKEFGKLLAQECPHLSYDPTGEPLSGNDPSLPYAQRVWGRLFIDSGWYPLVLRTAKKVEAEITKLPEESRQYYYIGQVKEKYAGLKFYVHTPCGPHPGSPKYNREPREADPGWDPGTLNRIQQITREADEESYGICERCGKPGQPRQYGWMLTHCDDCFDPEELEPDAWDGCIVVDDTHVHGPSGSMPLEGD